MDMQPRRLQRGDQGTHIAGKKFHQHYADDGYWHGYGTDDLYRVPLLGDECECSERPDEAEQHFIDAGEWGMSGLVPAVSDSAGVRDQSGPGGQRRELHVRVGTGDAETQIEGSCSRIEHQGGIEQISFAENASGLDDIQKSDEQQKGDAQPYHRDQRHAGRGMLFYFGACHTCFLPSLAGLNVRRWMRPAFQTRPLVEVATRFGSVRPIS